MIPINPKSGLPIWEQIKDQLKRQILMGVWSPGEQLPSVRALASELGINPNTIQRSYTELEREGLTYTVAGKGCFVEDDLSSIQTKKSSEALAKLEAVLKELRDSGIDRDTVVNKVDELYKEGSNNDQN